MARTKTFDTDTALNKALLLFWDKGYHDSSMQELVTATGLSRSSIYDTFGDKYGLFLAALNFYKKNQTQIEANQIDDLESFLVNFFSTAIQASLKDEDHKGCFFVNSSVELAPHDEEVRSIVNANMEAVVQNFELLYQKHQEAGNMDASKKPRALANFTYGTLSSIKLISRSTKDKNILQDIADTAVKAILN